MDSASRELSDAEVRAIQCQLERLARRVADDEFTQMLMRMVLQYRLRQRS